MNDCLLSSDEEVRSSIAGLVHWLLFPSISGGKVQLVPTLLFVTVAVDNAALRDIDDFNKLCTCKLATSARSLIVGIAGYPKWIKLKVTGQRNQEPERTSRVFVSAVSRVDGVAHVSGIQLDMRTEPDPKIDRPEFFSGISLHHAEIVGGNFVDGMWLRTDEFQYQFPVLEGSSRNVVLVRHSVMRSSLTTVHSQPPCPL